MIELKPDDSWISQLSWLRNLVGGTLAVAFILMGAALVITVVGIAWVRVRGANSEFRYTETDLLKIVLIIVLLGALSGAVAWGMGLDFGLDAFSGNGKQPANHLGKK